MPEKTIDDMVKDAEKKGNKKPEEKKPEKTEEEQLADKVQDAYKNSKPSGFSKLLGLGALAASAYFLGPVLASWGPTAGVAAKVGGLASKLYYGLANYGGHILAGLMPGLLGYAIPTSVSRGNKAKQYLAEQEAAEAEKAPKPGPPRPGGGAPRPGYGPKPGPRPPT